jgi:hypothetical protein
VNPPPSRIEQPGVQVIGDLQTEFSSLHLNGTAGVEKRWNEVLKREVYKIVYFLHTVLDESDEPGLTFKTVVAGKEMSSLSVKFA